MGLFENEDGSGQIHPPPRNPPKPKKDIKIVKTTKPIKKSGGGRGSSGSNNGGGGRGSSGGGSSRPPAGPSIPSIGSYLGTDDAYQQTVRGGKRSLTDFISEISRRRGEAGTTFNQTKSTMESDRVRQLESLRDEFASRGLIQSGLFGKEQGRFQEQFDTQRRGIEQQQAGLLADLLSQERNFRREQELALEVARQEALARRAQQHKIGG